MNSETDGAGKGPGSMNDHAQGKPSWPLYFWAASLIFGYYILLGSTLRGVQGALTFKILAFYVGKPFGVAASATNNFFPLDINAELRSIFCNPVFYSAVLIGFKCIRQVKELYRGAVPALIVLSPIIALTVIPNPGMLFGLSFLLQLLGLVVPYFLIGGLLGWGAFRIQSRINI